MKDTVYDSGRRSAGRWFDLFGWVAFVLWIALVFFFKPLPEGVGSLGVGVIVFLVAAGRRLIHGTVTNFWLLIGGLYVAAGIGNLLDVDFPFTSFALILTGVLMLCHRWARKH